MKILSWITGNHLYLPFVTHFDREGIFFLLAGSFVNCRCLFAPNRHETCLFLGIIFIHHLLLLNCHWSAAPECRLATLIVLSHAPWLERDGTTLVLWILFCLILLSDPLFASSPYTRRLINWVLETIWCLRRPWMERDSLLLALGTINTRKSLVSF